MGTWPAIVNMDVDFLIMEAPNNGKSILEQGLSASFHPLLPDEVLDPK